MPRLPRVTAEEIGRALERVGFAFVRQRGSHRIYRHPESQRRVVVPYHGSRVVPPGTLANVLRQANLDIERFVELLME